MICLYLSDIPHVLAKFNSFDKYLKFTVDDFFDSLDHFLGLKITDDDGFPQNNSQRYINFSK